MYLGICSHAHLGICSHAHIQTHLFNITYLYFFKIMHMQKLSWYIVILAIAVGCHMLPLLINHLISHSIAMIYHYQQFPQACRASVSKSTSVKNCHQGPIDDTSSPSRMGHFNSSNVVGKQIHLRERRCKVSGHVHVIGWIVISFMLLSMVFAICGFGGLSRSFICFWRISQGPIMSLFHLMGNDIVMYTPKVVCERLVKMVTPH